MPAMLLQNVAAGADTPAPRTFVPTRLACREEMTTRVLEPLVGVLTHASATNALHPVAVRAALRPIAGLCEDDRGLGDGMQRCVRTWARFVFAWMRRHLADRSVLLAQCLGLSLPGKS